MKNPLSYRNRFASYLGRERKAIDAGVSERTRDELYQQLSNERTYFPYLDAQKKKLAQKELAMEKFRKERALGEDQVSFLNGTMAQMIIDDYSQQVNNEGKRLPFLHLYGLKKLTPAAVQVLSNYNSELYLPWRALQENPAFLEQLSKRRKDTIFLRVGEVSPEMAAACKATKAKFLLQHVDPLSKAVLEQFKECHGSIFVYSSQGGALLFSHGAYQFKI